MTYIKKFIDKVSLIETRQGKDVVISMSDARGLRDELAKLLVDKYEESKTTKVEEQLIQVEVKGGKFK